MTQIKFCGLTRAEDVAVAIELGVDALGFVMWSKSPRAITCAGAARLIAALPPSVMPVGVFVRPTRDEVTRAVQASGIRVVQVHGTADVEPLLDDRWEVWAATAEAPDGVTILLDAHDPERHGGTGRTIDWDAAARLAATRRVMLAGGLTPENVAEAIRRARPYGVDVSSGIEDRPGIKNAAAMRKFVAAVRDTGGRG